ncbi:MAG: hypothetical protein AB2L24_10080 [Mangrovibacterium sp.]
MDYNLTKQLIYGLIVMSVICPAKVNADNPVRKITGANGKPLSQTIGVTHTGASYTMNSKRDCMQEGAERIFQLGSRVIKLWFADTTVMKYCYPYNCHWSKLGITTTVDLAKCEHFRKVFDMDFHTYVLETSTFDFSRKDANVNWGDGMDEQKCRRTEKEMYELAKYLMTEYKGTGKEFVLQNWEGDNMLGGVKFRFDSRKELFYKVEKALAPSNKDDDQEIKDRISAIIAWFNARQRGVDKARAEMAGLTDVLVRNALEINFVYLNSEDDGWPFHDSPKLIDRVIQYTDCDLYSFSSWGTGTVARASQLNDKLKIIEQRLGDTYIDIYENNSVKVRRPFLREGQKSRLMLGEYGSIEGCQYSDTGQWGRGFTSETDMRHRMVLQIQTDIAESLGLEYILFWELHCNVYRGDILTDVIDMVKGDQIQKNEHLQGNWLIRVDGSCTEGYKYIRGLVNPADGVYKIERFTSNKTYKIPGENSGFEIISTQISVKIPNNLEDRKSLSDRVKVYGSVDGKEFKQISSECFFTSWKVRNENASVQVVYINRETPKPELRYFRVENSGGEDLKIESVKFYKPNPIIIKQ